MGNDTTLPESNDKSALETEEEAQLVEEHIKVPARMRRAPTYLKDYIYLRNIQEGTKRVGKMATVVLLVYCDYFFKNHYVVG